jgi:hypothetical protein
MEVIIMGFSNSGGLGYKIKYAQLTYEVAQNSSGGASTGGSYQTRPINTKTLETICDEYNIKHINYLSIDVEGAEFDVIKSINFDKVFIDVIGFENNYNDVSIPIIEYLKNKNYIIINNNFDIFMIHSNSSFRIT